MSASPLRRIAVTAATSSTALLMAACGSTATNPPQALGTSTPGQTAASTPTATQAHTAPSIQWAVGTPLVSDGSATVTIGGVPVTFPTKVTEAAWAPDGSRIAFVDGDGNLATARPDGSSLVVLVKPAKGSTLSEPVWDGGGVVYVEQLSDGSRALRQASYKNQTKHDDYDTSTFIDGDLKPLPDTFAPAASAYSDINGDYDTTAFQHKGAKGSEIWIHTFDSNSRGGANPAVKEFDGSWPAIGGHKLAFVGANGQIEVSDLARYAMADKPPKTVLVTTAAKSPTHLTWAADHKSIAYSTTTDVESVPIDDPNATPTKVSDKPGVVSFLPADADQLAKFTGSDLTGTSIALSQWRWATQTGQTAMPAGGGPHGPYGMTVTLVVGTDPAAARQQSGWAGMYGPTLVVNPGDLDSRVTSEIKRVLGKPLPQDPNASSDPSIPPNLGAGVVYIVDPASVVPKSADAAVKSLGYLPIRITKRQGAVASSCVLVADQGATTDITMAADAGCKVMTVANGALSADDAKSLPDIGYTGVVATSPVAAAAAMKALTAVPHLDPNVVTITGAHDLPTFTAALAAAGNPRALTVIPADSPEDALLARIGHLGTTVVIDPAHGLPPALKTYLDEHSAIIDTVNVIDTDGKLGVDLLKQVSTLVSGPLGPTAVTNPTADARPKAW